MRHSRGWWWIGSALLWLWVTGPAVAHEPTEEESTGDEASTESDGRADETRRERGEIREAYAAEVGGERTLEQLVSYAEDHAPEIRNAEKRLALGDAEMAGARMLQPFNPEIESELGLDLGGGGPRKLEVMLRQRLEIAGQRALRIEAARRRKGMLEEGLDRARWKIRHDVRRSYRLGLVERRRLELQRRVVEFTDELIEIAEKRREAGEDAERAVLVSRAESATARQTLVERWKAYIRTLGDLATTVGWESAEPPQPAGDLGPVRGAPSRERLLERAYDQDPELGVLRARLDEVRARQNVATREVWPNPVLGLGVERSQMGTPAVSNTLRLTVEVPLPLWDRNQGDIAQYRARERVVREQIENRKRVLKNRIGERVQALEAAYRRAEIYEKEVLPSMEKQLELLRKGFELGEMDLLEVMDARDRLLDARRRHLDTLAGYVRAVSELEGLLGGPLREGNDD